jgi:hypothetical protein
MSFSFFLKHNGLMFAALLRRRSEPGLLAQYMQRYHAPILEIPEVKALVLAIFFGLLFTNIVSLHCCPFLLLAAFCLSLKGNLIQN